MSKINATNEPRILQLRRDGMQVPAIAKELGVSPATLYNYIKATNLFAITTYITEDVGARLIQYREDGLTLNEMSDKEGFNPQVISRYLLDKGLSAQNSRVVITEELGQRIIEMNATGEYYINDIALELGCVESTVARYLKRNNIEDNCIKLRVEIDDSTADKITELFHQHQSSASIAESVGLGRAIVKRFLKEHNLKYGAKIPETKLEKVIKLIEDGYNYTQIGNELDVNKTASRRFCLSHDLQSKKPSPEEQEAKDLLNRIRSNLSKSIHRDVKEHFCDDEFSINDVIPWTIGEWKANMERQWSMPENLTPEGKVWMNWDNWGQYDPKTRIEGDYSTYTWHVDHIKPQSDFHYISVYDEEFQKVNDLSNLRPLEAKQNVVDGARRTRHEEKPGYVPTYFTAEDLKEAQAKEKAIPKELNDTYVKSGC